MTGDAAAFLPDPWTLPALTAALSLGREGGVAAVGAEIGQGAVVERGQMPPLAVGGEPVQDGVGDADHGGMPPRLGN